MQLTDYKTFRIAVVKDFEFIFNYAEKLGTMAFFHEFAEIICKILLECYLTSESIAAKERKKRRGEI
jgi:hypothetical protein